MTAAAISLLMVALAATGAAGREQIQIAGSSTVLPYAAIAAEAFGENFDFRTPVVEGGGSGAGRKKLCEGVGENTIDIANSSSRITPSDIDLCASNGVSEIREVRLGYDGIVFATAQGAPQYAFAPADWYNALAANVLVGGVLAPNPNTTWADVNGDLAAQEILAFIPGTKHGTREVFDTRIIEAGCVASGAFAAFKRQNGGDEDAAARSCLSLRTDGRSVDIDGDYTETLARIEANPNAIGVFGLSFYRNNTDRLRAATLDGVFPSSETIASGAYPASRPLYFYVKIAHLGVIPGLREFIAFFVSDDIAGPDGLLAEYGLVPDPQLAATQKMVATAGRMDPLE